MTFEEETVRQIEDLMKRLKQMANAQSAYEYLRREWCMSHDDAVAFIRESGYSANDSVIVYICNLYWKP